MKKRSPITPSSRPLTVGEKREKAAQLFADTGSFMAVGKELGVSAIKARDLCLQHRRLISFRHTQPHLYELSTAAITAIVTCEAAWFAGKSVEERLAKLFEIAASCNRRTLLVKERIAPKVLDEIQTWLASKGRAFRNADRRKRSPQGVSGIVGRTMSGDIDQPCPLDGTGHVAGAPTVIAKDEADALAPARQLVDGKEIEI